MSELMRHALTNPEPERTEPQTFDSGVRESLPEPQPTLGEFLLGLAQTCPQRQDRNFK